MSEKVLVITTVSPDAADNVLNAIALAGGGQVGNYTHCAFTTSGDGRFKATDDATPHVGQAGAINREPEIRIETFCPRNNAKSVVDAIRAAHPYEEPVIYVVPILSYDEL